MTEGRGLKILEPLRELFKDEVRDMGRQLGIAEHLVMRHPFPGPVSHSINHLIDTTDNLGPCHSDPWRSDTREG